MGRTCWDRSNAALMAPQATYFYCSEMLRPCIYNSCRIWQPRNNIHKVIVSVISPAIYKGGDVILKTAEVLKKFGEMILNGKYMVLMIWIYEPVDRHQT